MLRTLSFMLLLLVGANAYAADATPVNEDTKIEALLSALGTSDVTFIRNGANMTGKEAKAHLQDKWKELQGEVHTAQDFIAKVATKSRESGKPYMIKLKDGKEMTSAEWLQQQLKMLDNPPQ